MQNKHIGINVLLASVIIFLFIAAQLSVMTWAQSPVKFSSKEILQDKKFINSFMKKVNNAAKTGSFNSGNISFGKIQDVFISYRAYDIIEKQINWSKGITIFYLGVRKKSVPRDNFLTLLSKHVKLVSSGFQNKGLKGYIVFPGKDFEAAAMNWTSRKDMEKCFQTDVGKELVADADKILDGIIWVDIHSLPKDYLKKFDQAIEKLK